MSIFVFSFVKNVHATGEYLWRTDHPADSDLCVVRLVLADLICFRSVVFLLGFQRSLTTHSQRLQCFLRSCPVSLQLRLCRWVLAWVVNSSSQISFFFRRLLRLSGLLLHWLRLLLLDRDTGRLREEFVSDFEDFALVMVHAWVEGFKDL